MDWGSVSEDQLDRLIAEGEREVSVWRAVQLAAIGEHLLTRDGGCTVEGCSSRYRLEAHHTKPWSHGGKTDADHLISLCWYHHHISIHQEGMQIIRLGQSRVRLKRPA